MGGGVRGFDPQRLRAAQERTGLSIRKLAKALGVSRGAVIIWRTGRNTPEPSNLRRLAEVLGCATTDLAPLGRWPSLSDYRERLGLSQHEMGLKVGLHGSAVSMVEHGVRTPADPARWAAAYGLAPEEFSRIWRRAARAAASGDGPTVP